MLPQHCGNEPEKNFRMGMANGTETILEGLDDEQRNAVECTEGPVLIVAGAGSGKTRVLTCRIAAILAKSIPAERVMALTFTKKAASEMKGRIAAMVGEAKARKLCMGTFHSVFIRFLREYSGLIGYPQAFTIYDQGDSTSAIKTCIKELGLDDKTYKPREVLGRISMAKNNLVTADAYRNNPRALSADSKSRRPKLCDIYSLYARKCKESGVMDFDDILLNMNILLRDHPEALESIAARYGHIMVDEYQDTNYAQYLILRKLSQFHRNICVVGDDSQSIYAFRGAKIENILNFKKDYPGCRTFRLERNYRSTRTIVEAANSLIAHNEGRIPKECFSKAEEGERIRLVKAYTEREEAVLVVGAISERMRNAAAEYGDFAILYRTNSQSRVLEEVLRSRNIPYMIYSGNSFFERAEVKDMMAYFKLAVNHGDDESFKRIVNKPARGIGDTSIQALEAAARAAGTCLFEAASMEGLAEFGLREAGVRKIRAFCAMMERLSADLPRAEADEMALKIANAHTPDSESLYAFYKGDSSIEGQARFANIEELLNSVTVFVEDRREEMREETGDGGAGILSPVTLDEFLENSALLSNVDVAGDEEEDGNNKVALMTVHSAKGLEYPYVFVTGMEENLFPSGGMMASPADIEEERRLFYVALTRAGKSVTLSFAGTRMRNGQHSSNPPSRFIKEIDSRHIENPLSEEDYDGGASFRGFGGGFGHPAGNHGDWRGGQGPQYGGGAQCSQHNGGGAQRGAWGGRFRHPGDSYAASSEVRYEPRKPSDIRYGGRDIRRPAIQDNAATVRRSAPPPAAPGFVPDPMESFRAGQHIVHNRFGPGVIREITGTHPECRANITFDRYGDKVILLKYAKMKAA